MGTILCKAGEGQPLDENNYYSAKRGDFNNCIDNGEDNYNQEAEPIKDLDRALLMKLREMLAIRQFTVKILLLGDKSVGKTSLINKYQKPYASAVSEVGGGSGTISIDFVAKSVELWGERVRIRIWDTPGGLEQMPYVTQFLGDVDEIVFCFSYDSQESAAHIHNYLALVQERSGKQERVQQEFQQVISKSRDDLPKVSAENESLENGNAFVVHNSRGNSIELDQDNVKSLPKQLISASERHGLYIAALKKDLKAQNVLIQEHILNLAAENGIDVLECSVKENQKIDGTFLTIVKNYIARTNLTAFKDKAESNSNSQII